MDIPLGTQQGSTGLLLEGQGEAEAVPPGWRRNALCSLGPQGTV